MRKLLCLILFILFVDPYSYGQTWPVATMHSVCSVGKDNFFIVGNEGSVFRSSDRGLTWKHTKNIGGLSTPLVDICFISETIGFIAGDNGVVLKTTDGGYSWLQKLTPTTVNLESIAFSTMKNGIAVGGKLIIRTTDAGESWATITTIYSESFHDVAFSSPNNGIIVISYPGWPNSQGFYLTNDSGKTWTAVPNNITWLGAVTSISKSKYIAVGITSYFGGIYRSTDGGSSWQIINSGVNGPALICVTFADSLFGIAAGYSGVITTTTDGGLTWNSIKLTTYPNVSIALLDSIAILIGDRATPLRSTDKGSTWRISNVLGLQSLETYSKDFFLNQNYPNPFNSATSIRFGISENTFVRLSIFNILGLEVETLVNHKLLPGEYSVQWNASKFSSGVYFYRIHAGAITETRKVLLIK